MTKRNNIVFFWVFVVFWGALIVLNLAMPSKEFSESENRYLKQMPTFSVSSMLDGSFPSEFQTYLSDQFIARPMWVTMQATIEYATGKREINSIFIGKNALLSDMLPADTNYTDKNVNGINEFAEKYAMPTYFAIIPSSTEIDKSAMPKFASGWSEKAYIDAAYAKASQNVTTIDIYSKLAENSANRLYYRTDHHWTTAGAFTALMPISTAMGIPTRDIADYDVTVVASDFKGTFDSKTGFPYIEADTIERYERGAATEFIIYDGKETTTRDSIYFDEYLAKKDKYSYFLGQVQPCVTIKTKSASPKKLIVFKDSYMHSLAPMLLDDFSEIRLVDMRFINPMKLDEILNIAAYDEALFIYSTDVFSHQLGAGLFGAVAQ